MEAQRHAAEVNLRKTAHPGQNGRFPRGWGGGGKRAGEQASRVCQVKDLGFAQKTPETPPPRKVSEP